MSRFRISVLIVCILISGVCLAVGDVLFHYTSELKSREIEKREKGAQVIRDRRLKVVNELIILAGEKVERLHPEDPRSSYPPRDSKHLSILLLGDLRAVEAVPVLVENLEYRNLRTLWVSQWDSGGVYPAAEALSKIGMPAVGPTIKKVSQYDKNGPARYTCCWVIMQILGKKLGKVRVEMAIEDATDPKVKDNLRGALWFFQTSKERAKDERAREMEAERGRQPKVKAE